MPGETLDESAETPPIPDDWQGEPRLAVFFIPSPVSVPLPHGSTFNFQRREEVDWLKGLKHHATVEAQPFPDEMTDGYNFVSFRVWRSREELRVSLEPFLRAMFVAAAVVPDVPQPAERQAESIAPDESYSTTFEAVTPLLPVWKDGEINLNDTIDAAFDRCIENLSELLRGYIAMSKDMRVTPVTRNSLFIQLPWTTRNLDASEWGGVALYQPNVGRHLLPVPVGQLSSAEVNSLMTFVARMKRGDPGSVFVQHARACRRAFYIEGDFAGTVVEAHISGEVFLDAILLMMAWEEGTSPEDAANWFDEGLSKRIRTHYGARLGGNWNTQDSASVLGQWAQKVRDIRNRSLHRGYWPSENEAYESVTSMDNLEMFVKDRLAERRNVYPRTTLLVLGRPGLEQRGVYRGKIKEFVETRAAIEPDWLNAYREWADAFDSLRAKT